MTMYTLILTVLVYNHVAMTPGNIKALSTVTVMVPGGADRCEEAALQARKAHAREGMSAITVCIKADKQP